MVPRGDAAHVAAAHPRRAQPARGRGLRPRLRRGQPARRRHAAAVLQRARPRHRHAAQPRRSQLPLVPSIFGFDPRFQFVHEDDVVRVDPVRARPRRCRASTTWPATATCRGARWPRICGKRTVAAALRSAPALAAAPLRPLGVDLPPELLDLLQYGRGVDNRRLKRAGFDYQYTSAGAVEAFVEALRLRQHRRRHDPAYQYQEDVEHFFRHSPRRASATGRSELSRMRREHVRIEVADRVARRHARRPRAAQRADLAMVDEIVDAVRRARGRRRASARSSSPARRRRSAPAPTCRTSASSQRDGLRRDLRRLPARRPLAAADDRRGQRRRGRRRA